MFYKSVPDDKHSNAQYVKGYVKQYVKQLRQTKIHINNTTKNCYCRSIQIQQSETDANLNFHHAHARTHTHTHTHTLRERERERDRERERIVKMCYIGVPVIGDCLTVLVASCTDLGFSS